VIAGFCLGVNEFFDHLEYYASHLVTGVSEQPLSPIFKGKA